MQWVVVGEPEAHRQRGKWIVRQGGYGPATGRRRLRQLGTFATKRDAIVHREAVAAGLVGCDDETVAEFVEQSWLPSKRGVEQSTLDQCDGRSACTSSRCSALYHRSCER